MSTASSSRTAISNTTPFRAEPAAREQQRIPRRSVQPLGIVDQAEQWTVTGDFGEQCQSGQPGQEPVHARCFGQTERGAQRPRLWGRQRVQPVEAVKQQQMQRRERQLGLRLHAGAAQHPEVRRVGGDVLEQRGFAAAGLALDHQDRAAPGPGIREQSVDAAQFRRAPVQHDLNLSTGPMRVNGCYNRRAPAGR